MRSVSYILTGRPRNRTDSIDYAKTHEPRGIRLEPHAHEEVTDAVTCNVLYATYIWTFGNLVVTYEEAYGRCFQHESVARQKLSVDNANRRLEKSLQNLRDQTGLEIENADERFGYDVVYDKR